MFSQEELSCCRVDAKIIVSRVKPIGDCVEFGSYICISSCNTEEKLFSMMFSAMLTDAFQDVDAGFPIRYRFDGKLLNLRRLQAKSKVQTDVVDKLLYADDLAENAKSEEKMQGAVDRMSKACDNFQLTISTKKTEVVHQPAPGKPYSEPTITVNGQKLQVVDKILEALSPEQCTLMMRSQPELRRPA